MVARASGQTYESFLTREVLRPLGLESATIARRAEDTARAATLHGTDGEPVPFHVSDHPAASDLYITVEDLARFGLFHAGGLQPSRPVITDASRRAMQEPGIGSYGFGWLVNPDWRGRRVIFNSGAKPGASAALWIVPADRVAVAIVANQIGAPVNQLAGELLASALGLEPAAPRHRQRRRPPGRTRQSRRFRRRDPSFAVSGAARSVHALARSSSRLISGAPTIWSRHSARTRRRSRKRARQHVAKRPARSNSAPTWPRAPSNSIFS